MYKPHSSQHDRGPDSLALSLTERPLAGMINLRGSPDDPAFRGRADKIIGLPLPASPNRFVACNDMQCVWQGPDEWLLVVPDGRQLVMADRLEEALDGIHHAVTDVTGNRVIFRLSGRNAPALLSIGCSIDFSEHLFPKGAAVQTLLAGTPVTILRIDDEPSFDIHLRRSYRTWLRDWLFHAAGSVDTP